MILAKYGQALTIEFPVLVLNGGGFAATGDWTPATGDTKVSKSAGAVANTTNNPSAVTGTGSVLWTLTLTATEMQSERETVQIVDAALEDTVIIIHTYGNASALHAVDLDESVRAGLTALPNAAADAAGGLPISDAGGLDLDAQIGTDIDAILVDTGTTLDVKIDAIDDFVDTEVAAILVDTGTTLDDLVDDLEARLTQVVADKLAAHLLAILTCVIDVGSTTTAVVFKTVNGAAASAVDDFYNGAILVLTSG